MRRVPEALAHHRSARLALLVVSFLLVFGCATVQQRTPAPANAQPVVAAAPGTQTEVLSAPPVAANDDGDAREAAGEAPVDADVLAEEEDVAEGEAEEEEKTPAPHDELAVSPPAPTPDEVAKDQEIAERQAPLFDIPMVVNDQVTAWIDYYSGRHRERFHASLVRSGRYLPMIQRTFGEMGIPKDLAYLAHVESAFKTTAYSRAKAKGMFQFMLGTGRRYGLRTDAWIDERSDPEKSARAAAAYLRDLHDMFGDWYLALAAYNAGEGKIGRSLARTGARDFWGLARGSSLRTETKNYVPAILAATLIAKNPQKYGFEYVPDAPLEYDTNEVRGAFDLRLLARAAGLEDETLRQLNPELRRGQTPPGRTTLLRVPPGTGHAVVAALDKVPQSTLAIASSVRHKVRKGETLGKIAARYHVSIASIERANRLSKRAPLQAGRALVIPTQAVVADWVEGDGGGPASVTSYRVSSGDTLYSIARRHGTTPAAIASASGISTSNTLRVGQELKVPTGAGRKRPSSARVASPRVHTVRSGETLSRIAARYQTSVDTICQLNDMEREDRLVPGKRLTVRAN